MVLAEMVGGPLPPFSADPEGGKTGAEVVFQGRVRDEENGRAIVALDYEVYAGMAGKELSAIVAETAGRFDIQDLFCRHRTGLVPVGEASLQIVIWSRHREAGLEAVAWLVREIKLRVPVWKWGICADGERFPSVAGARDPS